MTDLEKGMEAARKGDCKTALQILPPLAEQGIALAQFVLGGIYYKGECVPKNCIIAYMWASLSIVMLEDKDMKARAVDARELAEAEMTPEHIGQAQKLADEWFQKHTNKMNSLA